MHSLYGVSGPSAVNITVQPIRRPKIKR